MKLHHWVAGIVIAGFLYCGVMILFPSVGTASTHDSVVDPELRRARENSRNPGYGKVQWQVTVYRDDGTIFDSFEAVSFLGCESPTIRRVQGDDHLVFLQEGVKQPSSLTFVGGVPLNWVVSIKKVQK